MGITINIAIKEIKDAFRNKLFLIILGLLFLLTIISIVLGSIQVRSAVKEYYNSIEFLKVLGKTEFPPMPKLNPISISKAFVNYLGMIGALLGIVLGSNAIVKEKKSGTLKLLLSRPIFRDSLLNGKLIGNSFVLAMITFAIGIITYISIVFIGNVTLSQDEIMRLILFFMMSFLYMIFFLVLAITFAIAFKNINRGLLITIIVWLILTFIFPQIGDTMDMDNQMPGGFFAQMGMTRDQEQKIVDKFKFYENLRNSIEEMSPTKHYERISFALLNVKPGFESNTYVQIVRLKWINLIGLTVPSIILCFISYVIFLRREDLY